MRLKTMMPLFLVALMLVPLKAFSWGGMKNKKGKTAVSGAAIQTIRERNIKRKAERSAILAAQEQAAASRSVVGSTAANPLSNVSATGAAPEGLCFTVCSGAKISHPCGVAPRCQNTAAFVRGCTNPSATNYNPNAKADDGSCQFSQLAQPAPAPIAQPTLPPPSLATCTSTCRNGVSVKHACGAEPYCPADPNVDIQDGPVNDLGGRGFPTVGVATTSPTPTPTPTYEVKPSYEPKPSYQPKPTYDREPASVPTAYTKPTSGYTKPVYQKPTYVKPAYSKPTYNQPTSYTRPTSSFSTKPAAIKGAEF
jgi:hypothetical protein